MGTSGRSGNNSRSSNSNGNGVPLCPNHGLECLSLTANTAANPGRRFFKCSHQTEADSCLKFAWADEFEDTSAGQAKQSRRCSCASGVMLAMPANDPG